MLEDPDFQITINQPQNDGLRRKMLSMINE